MVVIKRTELDGNGNHPSSAQCGKYQRNVHEDSGKSELLRSKKLWKEIEHVYGAKNKTRIDINRRVNALFSDGCHKNKKPPTGGGFKCNKISAYRCDSIFLTKEPFGCAPTNLSTTCPFLMNRIAGMEVMP